MTGGSVLKKFHTGKRILTLFMPGFLFGIIYTNFIARQYVAEPEVFSDYFLQQFLQTRIVAQEFIWYVLKVRAIPFAVLLGLAFTKMRKMTASLFAIWTGISGGILLSIAVTELGIRGSIFCLLGIFPQFLFYIPSFLIVLSYCWMYPKSRWSREKTIMSVGMLLSGNLCKSVFAACFSEKILVVFFKNGFAVVRRRQKRKIILTTNWLIRSPQRYPCMPDSGITI